MGFREVVDRLEVTRARIEAEVSRPAIIAVTSAIRGDGSTLLATALAHSFASVGHSVLFVGADHQGVSLDGARPAPKLSDRPDYDILSFVKEGLPGSPSLLDLTGSGIAASGSRETTEATFARFRASYPFTIVDAAVLAQSGLAFTLASAADRVVVAFKRGRAAGKADQDLVKLLASAHASIFGVVLLDPKAIRAFPGQRTSALRATPLAIRSHAEDVTTTASAGVRVS